MMTETEKSELITTIFSQQDFFEKEILDITTNSDRIEVMDILAKRMIRILLKEELNFLYMKNLDSFKFSLITNLLFREIASEWVSYSDEKLSLNKEEALEIIQDKAHVLFVIALIKQYYEQYKIYFFQEIADSFIELVDNMPNASINNSLIDEVLKSEFVKNQNISVVHSYSQLWSRVRNAHRIKTNEVTIIQIEIAESKNEERRRELEYKEEVLEETPLAFFDEALQRLRNTMTQYMMGIERLKE